MSESDGTTTEYPPLSDVVTAHQNGCETCQQNRERKPIPNLGGSPTLCSELIGIFQQYAQREGEVNNIVAHDEYGNAAPRPEA